MPEERWRFGQGSRPFRPVRDLEDIRRRVEDEIVRPVARAVWERIPEEVRKWSPSFDVYQKGETFEVKVELPGMKEADLDVSVMNDILTIKGERTPEADVKEEDYYHKEILYGKFSRSLTLPAGVDPGTIEAKYEDGILRIILHKTPEATPKKVNIKVNQKKS